MKHLDVVSNKTWYETGKCNRGRKGYKLCPDRYNNGLSCNHPFKHLEMLSSIVPGYFIARCMKCNLQNMYSLADTYCLTTKRKNELAKNIGIVQTELDKARLVSERCFEILKEAWHSNNNNKNNYDVT
jgi:hypothetical protein